MRYSPKTPRVRADMGYPPLVTPLSPDGRRTGNGQRSPRRAVTSRSARRSRATSSGEYGKAPGEVNAELAKQVLGDEQPMTGRFADTLEPEFPAAREHLGTHARSEEDVLSYIAFPQQAEQFFERREQTFTASYSFKEVK